MEDKPKLVFFFSENCKFCTDVMKTYNEVAKQLSDKVEFLKLDTKNPIFKNIAEQDGILAIPSFTWIVDEMLIKHSVWRSGTISLQELTRRIELVFPI